MIESVLELERNDPQAALELRARLIEADEWDDEDEEIVLMLQDDPEKLKQAMAAQNTRLEKATGGPGSRGGKWYRSKTGKIQYGEPPSRISKLKKWADEKKLDSAESFTSADLGGVGAKTTAHVVAYIDKHSHTRLNLPELSKELSQKGDWHFLHKVNVVEVDAHTHGEVETPTDVDLKTPIVVNHKGEVIDGRHRVMAAREKGIKELPAYIPAHYLHQKHLNRDGAVEKALPRKSREDREDEQKKESKPQKAAKKTGGTGVTGRTRYTYPGEKGGDKKEKPQQAKGEPKQAPAEEPQEEPGAEQAEPVQSPIRVPNVEQRASQEPAEHSVNLEPLLTQLETTKELLQRVAQRFQSGGEKMKGRVGFTTFMITHLKEFAEKHHLDGDYFGLVYDVLTGTIPEAGQEDAQMGSEGKGSQQPSQ